MNGEVSAANPAAISHGSRQVTTRWSSVRSSLPLDANRLRHSPQHAVIVIDQDGLITSWNDAATRLFGWSGHEIVGQPIDVTFTPADREAGAPAAEMARAIDEGCFDGAGSFLRKDGTRLWASAMLLPLADETCRGFVKIVRDQAEAKSADDALRESEQLHRLVTETVPQLVWRSQTDGFWDWASPQWTTFTGQPQADSLGIGWLEMVHPDDRRDTEASWEIATNRREEFNVEHRLRRADGSYFWFKTRAVPLFETEGAGRVVLHWFGTSTDIHAVREAQERILFLAHHDDLTGAANRALLRRTLEQATRAERVASTFFVLYVDLDKFKDCNDRLGHRSGDLALREIADRLRSSLTAEDLLARVGGDEFVVVRSGDALQPVEEFGETLVRRVAAPIHIDDHVFHVSASVGIAAYPADGHDPDELLRRADMAMARAKRDGGDQAVCFDAAMDHAANERRRLLSDLDEAIEGGTLHLDFQPYFSLRDGQLRGFEALARWTHPHRGAIPPTTFIPLAETSGRIVRLGSALLEQACAAAVAWPQPWTVAINLSPAQFRGTGLIGQIERTLKRSGLPADRLEFEVTEGLLIDDPEDVLAKLLALKAIGIRIALDDFGIGYSSLSYIRRFPFDKVKIDRQFVQSIGEDRVSEAIVSAVVAIGEPLQLTITAEGVETERQLDLVRALGCDQAQGYLLGAPSSQVSGNFVFPGPS